MSTQQTVIRLKTPAPEQSPVWLITGCSTGLGRALAQRLVHEGYRVIATARDQAQIAGLAANAEARVLLLDLDVTIPEQIDAAIAAAHMRFGRIDVLVNNAGYGYQSSIEEGRETEIRAQFDVNVFGLFAVTRAVLPIMRAQRKGRILNLTSVAGLIGFPGSGYYAASKHAVEGFSDALRAEVESLGIGVTCIEPGPFRTEWAGHSLRQTSTCIADYVDVVGKRLDSTKASSGNQAGDPVRAAQLMIKVAQMTSPPRHLPLGAWGYDAVLTDHRRRMVRLEEVRSMSVAADYPLQ